MTNSKKKTARERVRAREKGEGSLVGRARDMFEALISNVEAKIAAGDVSITLLRDVAGMIRAAATLDGELRKAKAEQRKAGAEITATTVLDWFRAQDHATRHQVLHDLERFDARKSGLA